MGACHRRRPGLLRDFADPHSPLPLSGRADPEGVGAAPVSARPSTPRPNHRPTPRPTARSAPGRRPCTGVCPGEGQGCCAISPHAALSPSRRFRRSDRGGGGVSVPPPSLDRRPHPPTTRPTPRPTARSAPGRRHLHGSLPRRRPGLLRDFAGSALAAPRPGAHRPHLAWGLVAQRASLPDHPPPGRIGVRDPRHARASPRGRPPAWITPASRRAVPCDPAPRAPPQHGAAPRPGAHRPHLAWGLVAQRASMPDHPPPGRIGVRGPRHARASPRGRPPAWIAPASTVRSRTIRRHVPALHPPATCRIPPPTPPLPPGRPASPPGPPGSAPPAARRGPS